MGFLRAFSPIVVVSGLPRSGTSMVMRMLDAGGMPILADAVRAPDDHNPHGYYELETVKALADRPGAPWLRDARGKAVKIVSPLLTWLPDGYRYRVIFLERAMSEILASQATMLASRGVPLRRSGPPPPPGGSAPPGAPASRP